MDDRIPLMYRGEVGYGWVSMDYMVERKQVRFTFDEQAARHRFFELPVHLLDSNRQESKCSSPPMPSSASPADRRDQEVRAPAETPPSHGGLGQGAFKPHIKNDGDWGWVVKTRPYIDGGPVLCWDFAHACSVAKQLKEMWDEWADSRPRGVTRWP